MDSTAAGGGIARRAVRIAVAVVLAAGFAGLVTNEAVGPMVSTIQV